VTVSMKSLRGNMNMKRDWIAIVFFFVWIYNNYCIKQLHFLLFRFLLLNYYIY